MTTLKRPKTLKETVERINNGELFSYALADFLDSFYLSKDRSSLSSMFIEEPPLLNCSNMDYEI